MLVNIYTYIILTLFAIIVLFGIAPISDERLLSDVAACIESDMNYELYGITRGTVYRVECVDKVSFTL